jgi:hypothetical protein
MKETFQPNDICLCKSAEEMKALIEYARERGVPVSSHILYDFKQYPMLIMLHGELCQGITDPSEANITPEQFRLKCDNWNKQPTPKEQTFSEGWISVHERLPDFNTMCDVWLKSDLPDVPDHRRIDYRFVENVGVTNKPAFQEAQCNNWGLYEMAFFIEEDVITHWMPSPKAPNSEKWQQSRKEGEK